MRSGLHRAGWPSHARLAAVVGLALAAFLALGAGGGAPSAQAAAGSPMPPGILGFTPAGPPTNRDLQLIKDSGASTVRFGLSWISVQDKRGGRYDWHDIDSFMLRASRYGLSVDFLVATTPDWASSRTNPTIWDDPIQTEVGRNGWERFVRAAALRYGHGGAFWDQHSSVNFRPVAWTIWNEPNLVRFWGGGPNPMAFARLVNFTSPIIRSVDPKGTIVVGGVFCQFGWENYLAHFYNFVNKSSFDALAIHPYDNSPYGAYKLMVEARQIMNRAGDQSAALWADEISWGTDTTKKRFVTTPKKQALNVRILFQLVAYQHTQLKLGKLLWYGVRDYESSSNCQFCASSGLWLANGMTPKPAWFVFKAFGAGPAGTISGKVSRENSQPAAGRQVWLDLNGDGLFEAGEPLRTTAASGSFSFPSLYPTGYVVRLSTSAGERCLLPANCTRTVQVQGGRTASAQFVIANQGGAGAPDTEITKQKIKKKKGKAKFKFTASGGKAPYTFECKLDKKHWKSCSSPKTYKHLKRGKHKFKVRAKGGNGKVDPTPAKAKFKIKRRR